MAHPGRLRKHDPIANDIERCIRLNQLDDARRMIGESFDIPDGYARTPLIHAAFNNVPEMLDWLIQSGADVNHQDRIGYSALHFAAQECHLAIATTLLHHGCDPNLTDQHGNGALWTASHQASLAIRTDNHLQMVSMLLASGADPDLINKHGKCPRDVGTRCEDPPLNSLFAD